MTDKEKLAIAVKALKNISAEGEREKQKFGYASAYGRARGIAQGALLLMGDEIPKAEKGTQCQAV